MDSGTPKMATRGNMHMNTRVIQVTEFNGEVSLDLRGHWEATKAYVDKQEGNGPIELPLVAILVASEAMAASK